MSQTINQNEIDENYNNLIIYTFCTVLGRKKYLSERVPGSNSWNKFNTYIPREQNKKKKHTDFILIKTTSLYSKPKGG